MYMKSETLFALFNLKSGAICTVRILKMRNMFYVCTYRVSCVLGTKSRSLRTDIEIHNPVVRRCFLNTLG